MENKFITLKIEKFFSRYKAFVKVEDELEPYCNNFSDDDFYELSKLEEIPCILDGDFEVLINKIYNRGYHEVRLNNCKIFVDKPNKTKLDNPIKNQFRVKIIKGD